MRNAIVVGLALVVTACASTGPAPPLQPVVTAPPPPPPVRLSAILGHGVYRTAKGVSGSCAGQSVILMHETPTYRSRIVNLYGSSEHALLPVRDVQSRSAKLGPPNENPLVASISCDGAGAFEFHGLEPGAYFIIARARQGRAGAAAAAGDYVIMQRVVLNEGETRDVALAP
jgi:hypothetical protein